MSALSLAAIVIGGLLVVVAVALLVSLSAQAPVVRLPAQCASVWDGAGSFTDICATATP